MTFFICSSKQTCSTEIRLIIKIVGIVLRTFSKQ